MEEEEKPLWYCASPQLEDIKVQKSDLILESTEYKIKPRMIEMVAANLFRGVKTDNPYRHVERFTMLCNTVQQEGVPVDWYKWNHFQYSLADRAKRFHSLASFEVEGNWNRLVKKFCEKIFPISRVQNVRKQVINFAQGEEEGIDRAWERFTGLIKQGLRLGFSGDVLLHTFYFSLIPECMWYVQICADGNIMEKTLTEATQLLQRISEGWPCKEIGKNIFREVLRKKLVWRYLL
jgi:hypothetical protein